MSLDKSLKKGGGLARARNVLTRAERLAVLQEDDRWAPTAGVFNLPKTKYRRLSSRPVRPEAAWGDKGSLTHQAVRWCWIRSEIAWEQSNR